MVRWHRLALYAACGAAAASWMGSWSGTPAFAGEPEAVVQEAAGDAAAIAEWIEELRSEIAAERNAATERLIAAGRSAAGPVAAAALEESEDIELPARCLHILRRLFQSSDDETRQAASEALEQLAEGDRAFLSRRAREILQRDAADRPRPPRANPGNVVRPAPFGAVPRFEREVEAEEEGKTVRIHEIIGGEITVTVTEPGDGQPEEVKAANIAELRLKHPGAFRLYDRHMRRAAVPPRLVGGAPVPGGPIAAGLAAGRIQVQVRDLNGQREIEVDENGRRIKISDRDGRDIRIAIRRPGADDDDAEEAEVYEADDLEALQRDHPRIAEVYERYAQQDGLAPFRGAGVRIDPFRIRGAPFGRPAFPGAVPPEPEERPAAERAGRQLEQLIGRLRRVAAAEDGERAEELREIVEELEAVRRRLVPGRAE